MAFYGYDPARYLQKDKYGIGAASQIVGQTVAGMPARIKAKEDREMALKDRESAMKAANEDWAHMDNAWKAIKSQYTRYAKPLITSGSMSQEEFNSKLKRLRMPTNADKKNAGSYIDEIGAVYGELVGEVQQLSRQSQISGVATEAAQGVPERRSEQQVPVQQPGVMAEEQQVQQPTGQQFTETDIAERPRPQAPGGFSEETFVPGKPPAGTFEEAYGNVPEISRQRGVQQPTKEQVEQYTALPKQSDIDKQRLNEMRTRRTERSDALGWANHALRREGMDVQQTRYLQEPVFKAIEKEATGQLALDKVDTKINEFQVEIGNLEKELPKLEEAVNDPMLLPEAKAEAEKNVTALKKEIATRKKEFESKQKEWVASKQKQLTLEEQTSEKERALQETLQKMRLSSEYARSLKKSKTSTSRETAPTTQMSPMEKEIRESLKSRGVDPQTIEAYIQEKKKIGAL